MYICLSDFILIVMIKVFNNKHYIYIYTVEDKILGANGFWLIKHSIWEQFSWFLVCIYSFYTQKWGTKNLSKIGHSCQVPKMA